MGDLLSRAREQAERSSPPVRAAALMRIARTQTKVDPGEARRTFKQGLDEARRLSGRDRDFLLEQARLLAAAAAPDWLSEISAPRHFPRPFWSETVGRIIVEHGHVDAAYHPEGECGRVI